jgi:hypothetical protein
MRLPSSIRRERTVGARNGAPGDRHGKATGFGQALAAEKAGDGLIDLAFFESADGVLIKVADNYDEIGTSVSGAGDVDGDGRGDILVGAPGPYGTSGFTDGAGKSYLLPGALLERKRLI